MWINIRVDLEGFYGHYAAGLNVPEYQKREFEPLKTCDDSLVAMATGDLFAGSEVVNNVITTRQDTAKELAKTIAEHLVRAMSKNDTHNGY